MASAQERFQRAVACFQLGRLREAEALCEGLLQADRRHVDALHVLGLIRLQGNDAQEAAALIRQSLRINPRQPVVHLNLGNALLRLGDARAALASCDAALALRPDYAEAWNNRGNALLELKRANEALASYEQALRLKPDFAVFHGNRANALRELERPAEALAAYDRALQFQAGLEEAEFGGIEMLWRLARAEEALERCAEADRRQPARAEVLHLRARILTDLERPLEALPDLERALGLQPDQQAVLVSLGNALFKVDRVPEALAAYQRAFELAPMDADIGFNRGNALFALRRYPEALESYDAAIAIRPQFAKAHYRRGNALRRLRRPLDALASYRRAHAIDGRYADALSGAGNALRDLNRLPEALASYEEALSLDPACVEALSNRARMLLFMNRPEEAVGGLERLFELAPDAAPDYNYALGMLLHSRLLCCDWLGYEATVAAIGAAVQAGKRVTLPSLMIAASDSPAAQLECARLFVEDNWTAGVATSWTGRRYGHARIRLAYVSADFREHPVSVLMASLFETHDRRRFETYAISLRPDDDSALGRRVRAAFDHFIRAGDESEHEIAAVMRELEIDIAVDLSGYTDGCRPGIFAARPAPVQVGYLGYPGTSAAPYMDYLVADRCIIPEAEQAHYTEKLVYLPHCYQPNDAKRPRPDAAPTRAACGLPERGFVFCSFNTHYKIVPAIFDVWMRLLAAVEGSVLWLAGGRESAERNLRREAAQRGVVPERLIFAPRLPDFAEHLARYRVADLFLDTSPFNAHTTASDALWMGLPVLTCRGRSLAGRVAASLLAALGLPELATRNLAEYRALAQRLAETPELLQALRERVAAHRITQPLFDTGRFRKNLESAYVRLWERAERGEAPQHLTVTE
jgi:predicted O-linked N-acetylglucosamine transferase (SPINDLY family)